MRAAVRRIKLLVTLAALGISMPLGAYAQERLGRPSGDSRDELPYDCLVDPARSIQLASPVRGILTEVLVRRGDPVTEGQTLARLESSVEQATVALNRERAKDTSQRDAARERLEFAQKRLDRAMQMQESGVMSAEALDEAETAFEVAENEYREAELDRRLARLELARSEAVLALRTVQSPATGVVTDVELVGGEFVREDVEILTIVELDPLHVETFVPQERLGTIAVGDAATVELSAPAGERREAVVTVVDPVIDAASGTLGIRLELPNPDRRLPGGMRCRIGFDEKRET